MDNQITCPHCQQSFLLNDALKDQIQKIISEKSQADLDQKLKQAKAEAEAEAKQRLHQALADKDKDLEATRQTSETVTKEYANLKEEMRKLQQQNVLQEKDLADKYDRKLAQDREDLQRELQDTNRLKMLEKDKQIADAKQKIQQLEDSVAKAGAGLDQNLNQLQGEVLELDMEQKLKQAFPYDDICEVKKFQKGADITQIVKNNIGQACGMILWEAKNALWKNDWIDKLKQDMGEAKANIAVLVSQQIPANKSEMYAHESDNRLWVVKPKLALALSGALRQQLIEVHQMSHHNKLKDSQMKQLYDYLTSPEFKYRIESVLDTYKKWQDDLDKEKKWFNRKWAKQEKMLNQLTMQTIGLHGDFQGITNDSLSELKDTDLTHKEIDFDTDTDELDVV